MASPSGARGRVLSSGWYVARSQTWSRSRNTPGPGVKPLFSLPKVWMLMYRALTMNESLTRYATSGIRSNAPRRSVATAVMPAGSWPCIQLDSR